MRAVLAAAAAALVLAAPVQAGEILLVAGCNDAAGARGFGSCLLGDDASAPPRLVSRDVAGGGFTPGGRGIVGETTGTAPGGFGNIATVQLDGSGYRLILDPPSEAFGIRPSPDGRTVAYWLFGGLDQPGVGPRRRRGRQRRPPARPRRLPALAARQRRHRRRRRRQRAAQRPLGRQRRAHGHPQSEPARGGGLT